MRSLQVQMIEDKESEKRYSDLQVLKSAAGYYIGTIHNSPEMGGFQEPGSRDSTYFPSAEAATLALTKLEMLVRLHPGRVENALQLWEYWLFSAGFDPHRVGYRFTP